MGIIKTFQQKYAAGCLILLLSALFSCAETSYIYQNGATYNDYEAVNNYRITNTTKKTTQVSKAPNWRKYNSKNKYKRYDR